MFSVLQFHLRVVFPHSLTEFYFHNQNATNTFDTNTQNTDKTEAKEREMKYEKRLVDLMTVKWNIWRRSANFPKFFFISIFFSSSSSAAFCSLLVCRCFSIWNDNFFLFCFAVFVLFLFCHSFHSHDALFSCFSRRFCLSWHRVNFILHSRIEKKCNFEFDLKWKTSIWKCFRAISLMTFFLRRRRRIKIEIELKKKRKKYFLEKAQKIVSSIPIKCHRN